MKAIESNVSFLRKILVLFVAITAFTALLNISVKADEVTTVVMTYEDKVFSKQLYGVDTDRIKQGVITDGLKSIGELCDNLAFQTNGSVSVDKNVVMDYVKACIVQGQKHISVDLTQYTKEALAARQSAMAQGAAGLASAVAGSANSAILPPTSTTLISNEALNAIGIDCKIASASTKFNANQDRAVNIRTAASKINGMILQPGQIFSCNLAFGPRTVANGYGLGNVISGDKYVKGVGGGICQVSSTLNLAVLRAGIIPTERHNHSHRSSYIGSGLDATISGSSLDYKFVNTLAYPVYISATADGGVLDISLYSNHDALCGITFEPNVTGGSMSNTTYIVGTQNGVPVINTKVYSSKYRQ